MSDRISRRIVRWLLSRTRGGQITLIEDGETTIYGDPESKLQATIELNRSGFHRQLLRGSTGLAESYADRVWECDDTVALIRIAAINMPALDRMRDRFRWLLFPIQRLKRINFRNTPNRSRSHIARHYDLGNDLFSLFLDSTMMYSCAYFETPQATLEEASIAKLRLVCDKLDLGPDDHLLEIGTGWGALAIYAAREYGCRVTTTTISAEQLELASARVKLAGLEDRITLLERDYRDLEGRFDKLVSIEMIEAVGWQYLDTFFEKCSELLEPDGLILLQAITIDDRAYEGEKESKSFINTEIFPGGCLPSLEVMARCTAQQTDLSMVGLHDITAHYSETLLRWRKNFLGRTEQAEGLGYDERFRRMWDFYLAYCEAGFRERRIGDVQLLLAKPLWRDPLAPAELASVSLDPVADGPQAAVDAVENVA